LQGTGATSAAFTSSLTEPPQKVELNGFKRVIICLGYLTVEEQRFFAHRLLPVKPKKTNHQDRPRLKKTEPTRGSRHITSHTHLLSFVQLSNKLS
jgi:hypothetical protein